MRSIYLTFAALLLLLTVPACSGSSHAGDPPGTAGVAQTGASADPYAVPPVITVAYVNSVLKALNHVSGNALRSALGAKSVTPQARDDLRAIYADPLYDRELVILQQSLESATGIVREPPGDRETSVQLLETASETCIFAKTTTTFSAVVLHPGPSAGSEYFELKTKLGEDDPRSLNPTPWAINFNISFPSATEVTNQCGSS